MEQKVTFILGLTPPDLLEVSIEFDPPVPNSKEGWEDLTKEDRALASNAVRITSYVKDAISEEEDA